MICSLVGLVTVWVFIAGVSVCAYVAECSTQELQGMKEIGAEFSTQEPRGLREIGAEFSTQEPRGLREFLRDTDLSLSSLLSQPVDAERVDFVFQFLLGYKGLIERLTQAANNRDPQAIEVFRDLKQKGWRPLFTRLLGDLSVRQQHFKWSDQDMDVLRTQILHINKLIDQFKKAVVHLISN